jgi:sulfoxide reductase catalytic subunit YedY
MLIGKPPDIPSSEITSRDEYFRHLSRRRFLKGAAAAGAVVISADRLGQLVSPRTTVHAGNQLQTVQSPLTTTGEQLTSYDDITHYNNYYEFGVEKDQPAKNAGILPTRPWSVKVEGLVAKPLTFDIDDLLKLHPLEDRTYRHRCVEAWSMVIPWVGYSLSEFIKQCQPLPSAKYVQFLSYYNRKVDKWGDESNISWPYSEGLRMDEAMNPLTLLTFGLYGQTLPNQDGAPVRVVIPWKYGFKSAKSFVKVSFVDQRPATFWETLGPDEYGFWANVNPDVPHPRWSQAKETFLTTGELRPTLLFNGYGDEVAGLYKGLENEPLYM